MSTVCHYPTDGSDAPWEVLQLVLPTPKWRPGGPGRNPLELRRVIHGFRALKECKRSSDNPFICRQLFLIAPGDMSVGLGPPYWIVWIGRSMMP